MQACICGSERSGLLQPRADRSITRSVSFKGIRDTCPSHGLWTAYRTRCERERQRISYSEVLLNGGTRARRTETGREGERDSMKKKRHGERTVKVVPLRSSVCNKTQVFPARCERKPHSIHRSTLLRARSVPAIVQTRAVIFSPALSLRLVFSIVGHRR